MMVSRFWLAVFVFCLVFSTAVAPILAVDNWPNYGRDPQHSGRNEDATGYDPTQFRPVWVFPRSGGSGPASGDEEIIDDLLNFGDGFTASSGGAWGISTDLLEPADDSYADRYIYSKAVLRNDTNTATAVFTWTPTEPGTYYIDVWFPSSMNAENALKNTKAADYVVRTGDPLNKIYNFRIDQSTGGEWVRLRPQAFELGTGATVALTNLTADAGTTGREDVLVVADAVRFVPTTGIEIYASPIADKAYVAPDNISLSIPVAYAATVETAEAYGAVTTDDLGAVYCIYSYTGYTMPPSGDHEGSIEWQRIGRPAWRYPKHPAPGKWGELEKVFQREVIPIEGPIEGGIYSTPTLAGDKIVFAGMDRQIYCVQASGDNAGQLIWKGPGITVSEPENVDGWVQVGDPKNDLGRGDAFGHKFLSTTAGNGNSITWMVSFPSDGLYSVYAWLPDKVPGEVRVSRAKYTVTYDGGSSDVMVDQDVPGNSGTWIKLGESYWRPSRVELSPAAADSEDAGKQVVADAVMFIPAELEAFSYSSPIVANNRVYVGNTNGRVYALDLTTGALAWVYPNIQKVQRPGKPSEAQSPPLGAIVSSPAYDLAGVGLGDIYVSSMDGRLYKLDAGNGNLIWQYPEETEEVAEERAFTSSPMVFGDTVYIGGTNGRLYAINKATGKPRWVRPMNEEDPTSGSIAEIPIGAIRYSTPAHDPANRNVLIGSTDGYVYAFKENTGEAAWGTVSAIDYRDSAAHVYAPVQAAVSLDANRNVYAATMDGAVWWLNADNGMFRTQNMDSGTAGYAVDGAQAFASPGVANRYLYCAWSSGHLIAFSWRGDGAFGDLADDQLPGYDDAPGAKIEKPVAAERPEVNIFEYPRNSSSISAEDTIAAMNIIAKSDTPYRLEKDDIEPGGFFNTSLSNFRGNPETDSVREAAHKYAWRSQGSQIFLEWGEKVYLIAWNLNSLEDIAGGRTWEQISELEDDDPNKNWSESDIRAKRNNVRFNFANSTPGPAAGQMANSKTADYLVEYELSDLDEEGNPQYRSLAVCVVDVGKSKRNPPAPGYGWRFSVNTRLRSVSGGRAVSLPSSVPELDRAKTPIKDTRREQIPQRIGVNNPLAIRDDQDFFTGMSIDAVSLAWPQSTLGPPRGNRNHPEAHFNGNGGVAIDPSTGEINQDNPWVVEKFPYINLGFTNHGTNSRVGYLGVMDRSAVGLKGDKIENFRIESHDLRWRGGGERVVQSGGTILPWEFPPPFQKDYPDISLQRFSMNKGLDERDPTGMNTDLPPAGPRREVYDRAYLVPDVVKTIVDVPQFQPANVGWELGSWSSKFGDPGYGTRMVAYLDGDGGSRGSFDDGNVRRGRPTTYIEPHRKFRVGVSVPPDLRILVEESTVDLGKAPHGMGIDLMPEFVASNATGDAYGGMLSSPVVEPWFKPITVKNVGNINLYNLRVTSPPLVHDRNWNTMIGGTDGNPFIRSSFVDPILGTSPYTIGSMGSSFGHTLAKARVGDPDPTELTLPDRRAIEEGYIYDWPENVQPPKPVISCQVPLGTPIGLYGGYVNVYADLNGDGKPNIGNDPRLGVEPISTPFLLKVQVRESQLTDGTSLGSLPNIDAVDANGILVKSPVGGDAQPAAWRDPKTGNMFVFWSTDRFAASGDTGPWYLAKASLNYERGFRPWGNSSYGHQWWEYDTGWQLPGFDWPIGTGDPNDTNVPGVLADESIRYTAPTVALHPSQYAPNVDNRDNTAWLFWQGQADFRDAATGRLNREYRLFYTDATGGDAASSENRVYSFPADLHMPKLGPRPLITNFGDDRDQHQLWLFYYGGDAGRWNIFATVADQTGKEPDRWSNNVKLLTPSALVSASEPMGVGRRFGTAEAPGLEVVYTGVSKYLQNSDLLMTRYTRQGADDYRLVLDAQKQPRVVSDVSEYRSQNENPDPATRLRGEILQRDSKLNVYMAKHMGWTKPPGTAVNEDVNDTDISSGLWLRYDELHLQNAADAPFVKVLIPEEKPLYATHKVVPEIDRATGVYRYTYPEDSPEAQNLGEMLMDPSAGIVRFTKLLPPKALVVAQYTPQALRLTTGQDPDNLPYTFLQKTPMDSTFDQALIGPNREVPVDRLWVFWRRPNTGGLRASTVYFKTYRLALDPPLTDLPAIKMSSDGNVLKPAETLKMPDDIRCQIDPSGRMIYFTEKNEIFDAMGGSSEFEITYRGENDNDVTIKVDGRVTPTTVNTGEDTINTVTRRIVWKEELPEAALLGYAADTMVNETQVSAFVDPFEVPTKVWVFWASTKEGSTDLFYEAISPNFTAR